MSQSIESGGIALGRNAATPGKHVESNSLPKQKVSSFTPDSRDVLDGLERPPFFHVPFHPVDNVNTIASTMNTKCDRSTHSQPS